MVGVELDQFVVTRPDRPAKLDTLIRARVLLEGDHQLRLTATADLFLLLSCARGRGVRPDPSALLHAQRASAATAVRTAAAIRSSRARPATSLDMLAGKIGEPKWTVIGMKRGKR